MDLAKMLQIIVYPIGAMLVMLFIKWADDRRTAFDEDMEIVTNSNASVALRKGGIYLGVALGMSGVLWGKSHNLLADLPNFCLGAASVIVLLFVSFLVNDCMILRRVKNDEAVAGGNEAVGVVEFASYVGSGLLINGSFSGEGGGIFAAVVFFLLGQVALVATFYLEQFVNRRGMEDAIEVKRNLPDGIGAASLLISISIILRTSIAGPFTGWAAGIQGFVIYFAVGLAALFAFHWVARKLFTPKVAAEKDVSENVALALIIACVEIGMAIVIAGAM